MTVWEYIDKLSDTSKTKENKLVLECLEHFELNGTQELELDQVAEWFDIIRRR